jgi:hypothetical protein
MLARLRARPAVTPHLVALAAASALACTPLREDRGALPVVTPAARPVVVGVDRRRPSSPHAIARGRMTTAPRERWRIDTSIQSETLAIRPSGRPGPPPAARAVEGSARRAHVLPGVARPQEITWSNGWTEGDATLRCSVEDPTTGARKLVWESAPERLVESPLTIVTDDRGGLQREIDVAIHFRVLRFDAATGRKLGELRVHDLRNYGFFGAFHEPGDPSPKFAIVSDFANHVDVIDANGARMTVPFRRDFESTTGGGILRHRKILRPGPAPLLDVDGDGHAELTINVFDDQGDGRWHVTSLAPLTGAVKYDIPGAFLLGALHLDDGGPPALVTAQVGGRELGGQGALVVQRVSASGATPLATLADVRGATYDLRAMPLGSTTVAAEGRRTLAAGAFGADGAPGFLVTRATAEATTLAAQVWREGALHEAWSLTAPGDVALSVDDVVDDDPRDPWILVHARGRRPVAPVASGIVPAVVAPWQRAADVAPAPLVVEHGARRVLVTEESGDTLAAYDVTRGPHLLWRRRGRGFGGTKLERGGLVAGDLVGDGTAQVVFVTADLRTGSAQVVAADDLTGAVLWQTPLSGFDGAVPAWNTGGVTWWGAGHLVGGAHDDVYVTARRSTMHSDESFVLDGRTGKIAWSGAAVPVDGSPTWGFGGYPVAFADVAARGRDQIVSTYPVVLSIADGATGAFLATVDLASKRVVPAWAAYGVPLVDDFRGDGGAEILVASPYGFALMDARGALVWFAPFEHPGPKFDGALAGRFAGGALAVARLAVVPEGKRLELLGARDGAVFATRAMSGVASLEGAIVADVDGDGNDDIVLRSAPDRVAALGVRGGALSVLWEVVVPSEAVHIAFADLDGDHAGELLVGCRDGWLIAFE